MKTKRILSVLVIMFCIACLVGTAGCGKKQVAVVPEPIQQEEVSQSELQEEEQPEKEPEGQRIQENDVKINEILEKYHLPKKGENNDKQTMDATAQNAESLQTKPEITPQNETETEIKPEEPQKKSDAEYRAELAGMVDEVYALRSNFTGRLNGMVDSAKAEYRALPAESRKSGIVKLGLKYAGQAGALEKQCDKEMNEILSRMETLMKEQGEDTGLIKEIRKEYENEKSATKAAYMEKVKGLI